jgi:hypothetical protein
MKVIEVTERTIDLSGINDHTVRNLRLVTAGGVTKTPQGDIIIVINHAADMTWDARSILSAGQLESFGCKVQDISSKVNGIPPSITTAEGYQIPIAFRKGLPYIKMRAFDKEDWSTLPQIHITSPQEWDPSCLDAEVPDEWYNRQSKILPSVQEGIISETGDLKQDLEDDGDVNTDDRKYQSVDRGSRHTYLLKSIDDKIGDGFIACKIEGSIHTVNYVPSKHDTYFKSTSHMECNVAETRSGKRFPPTAKSTKEHAAPIPAIPISTMQTEEDQSDDEDEEGVPDLVRRSDDSDSDDETIGNDDNDKSVDEPIVVDYNNPAKTMETSPSPLKKPAKHNLERYAQYLPGSNLNTIKRTFDATTQLGTRGAVEGFNLRNRLLSPNPVLNIPRCHEDVATDTVYSRIPAMDDGSTAAQFFIGRKSQYRTVTPMGQSDKHFAPALMDVIQMYGAMDRLISDNAKAQISDQVRDILRTFCIKDWQSEPYKGNQNFAERGWKDTKTRFNNIMNTTGANPKTWLLALKYTCEIQNHLAIESLNWRTPTEWLLGYTPDITVFLQFRFWEPVYYAKYDGKFPADSTEELRRFVGIGKHVGHAMTFKILTKDDKVIHRSVVRSATGT